jgi:hypothetical protein
MILSGVQPRLHRGDRSCLTNLGFGRLGIAHLFDVKAAFPFLPISID